MSHVVVIQLEVKDLEALKVAAERLGGTLVIDRKTFRWYGRWMNDYSADNAAYKNGVSAKDYGKCDHAITHPKCSYDVGLVKQPDGKSYIVVADEWQAGGLATVFGKGMSKLKQQYGVAVAARTMRKQGFSVREVADTKTDDIRLVCTRA
jgi:hypothetical protein